jgi:DNA primase
MPAPSEQDDKEDYLRSQLIEFGKFANAHFGKFLQDPLKGSVARQYLKSRDLKPETIKRFGMGFAPEGWSNLLEAAREAGFKDYVIEGSGLVRRSEQGRFFDFFRNRLMIPIRDVSANVAAFGGRVLTDEVPKYINSPENALYKKARVLYGLCEARDAMRKERRAILVEGYFDLIRCFDAGVENVVATCGTALTPEQASLIHRYVPEVVIVYDADSAGVKAALRGVGLLTNAGLTVRAMALPDGKDPDDYVRAHGGDAFRGLVDGALNFVSFYIRMSRDRLSTIEGRTEVAREIFSILANLNDELRRDEYLKQAARELNLHEWVCRGEFSKFMQNTERRQDFSSEVQSEETSEVIAREDQIFIAALLGYPDMMALAKKELSDATLPDAPVFQVLRTVFEGVGPDVSQRLELESARNLYAAAATETIDLKETAENIVTKRIARVKKDALRDEADKLQRELFDAEAAGDRARVFEILKKKAGINREIERVGVA